MRYSFVCWCIHIASDELSVMHITRTGHSGHSHADSHARCFDWTTNQISIFVQGLYSKFTFQLSSHVASA